MHRSSFRTFLSAVAIVATGAACLVGNALADDQLLGPVETRQLGMEEVWRRNLSVPAGANSIVDQTMMVHRELAHNYVEIVGKAAAPTVTPTAKTTVGGFQNSQPVDSKSTVSEAGAGEPIVYARLEVQEVKAKSGLTGQAEAERLAANEIRRLKRRGIEAVVRNAVVPMIRFYTLANDGTVECRDAETGELIWLQRVGVQRRGYGGLGVSEEFVTVVNGSELIELDVANGQEISVTRLRYVPLRGAVHCAEFAIVPSVGNRMVCYGLSDPDYDPFAEIVAGGSLAMPVRAADSNKIAWGTTGGFFYVMEVDGKPNVQFRLNTDGVVSGAPAVASGERFFFGSEYGQIYAIQATREGVVLWNRPTGEPIHESPIFLDEKVLFRTDTGNLMCVSASDGYSVWPASVPSVQQLIGVIDGAIYARSLSGSLMVLSFEDGSLLGRFPGVQPRTLSVNRESDRLYLINNRGTMQCLRRPGAILPTVIESSAPIEKEDETPELKPDASQEKQKPAAGADPFGGGTTDPFGTGGSDPFGGGGNDPFAPANGGNDPFGNSPF